MPEGGEEDMKKTAAERRRFYRHPLCMPIRFYEKQERIPDASRALNVSDHGICFMTPRFIPKRTRVNVTIPVGGSVFKINGVVVYSNHEPYGEQYKTGVAFSDQTSAFRAKLAEQIIQIDRYRKRASQKLGHLMPEEEAARQWIEKNAERFACLF